MVDDALPGNRLIGMIQPVESEETVLRPKLSQVGCAGRDHLLARDRGQPLSDHPGRAVPLPGEGGDFRRYRLSPGGVRFRAFRRRPGARREDGDFPRERLLTALKDYLSRRDMKADWKSVMTAPAESLVNALAMMCPFEPAEKQALLEAPKLDERVSTLVALLEMASAAGPRR